MTEPRKLIITYSHGSDAEETTACTALSEELASRLPLRNVLWQNPLGASNVPRVVSTLPVELKRFTADTFPRVTPGTLYHSPFFLHLFIVTTDDNEHYKANLRKQIQEWLNVVANKKNQEWLIVYFSSPETRGKSARFLGVGTSVYDKIKSDFGFKKERCLRVKLYNEPAKDSESWTELLSHIKEGVTSSLNQQVLQYDEDTRRLDSQRLMPGWNYCQYFIMKEGLAYTFEIMNLFDESLLQYDELEASFFQTLTEQGAPWFANFGGTDIGDDSGDILNTKRKSYREMIIQNEISIFDFRIYLFARQCQLLFRMGNAIDICQRAKAFITQFARTIRENEVSLIPYFAESWIFTACMNVIGHCEELVAVSSPTQQTIAAYEGVKLDLLQYARMQLDRFGAGFGLLLDSIHANVPSKTLELGEPHSPITAITNEELKNALASENTFDDLYLKVTSRAVKSCELSGHTRTMWLLKGDIAHLYYSRERLQEAVAIWDSMVYKYSANGWTGLDLLVMEKLAICQKKLQRTTQYLEVCLHIVANADLLESDRLSHFSDEFIWATKHAENVVSKSDNAIASLQILSVVNDIANDAGVTMQIEFRSILPKEYTLEEMHIDLLGPESMTVRVHATNVKIVHGLNVINLMGQKITTSGTYTSEQIVVSTGKLRLSYRARRSFKIVGTPVPVGVTITLPEQTIEGDPIRQLRLQLSSNEHAWTEARLQILAITNLTFTKPKSVSFRKIQKSDISHSSELNIDTVDGQTVLPPVEQHELVTFNICLGDYSESQGIEHKVRLLLSYSTPEGKRFHTAITSDISLAPPLHVAIITKESPQGLLLQFILRGISQIPIRLLDMSMVGAPSMAFPLSDISNKLIHSGQSIPVLYRLMNAPAEKVQTFSQSGDMDQNWVQVAIRYRSLREEVENFILSKLEAHIVAKEMQPYSAFLRHAIATLVFPSLSYDTYAVKLSMDVSAMDLGHLDYFLRKQKQDVATQIRVSLADFIQNITPVRAEMAEALDIINQSTLTVRTPVSSCQILLAATLQPEDPALLVQNTSIGSSINCQLQISVAHWFAELGALDLSYEIFTDCTSWLIRGKRKQNFVLQRSEDAIAPFNIVLLPVQTGRLEFPKIAIYSSSDLVDAVYPSSSLSIDIKAPLHAQIALNLKEL
ncbi:hypothetical protein DFS34DRAFT_621113 [Phlyctochytrium arcticum]|nr:hypothetical protein DFS34DRAFT_621113 [Phlyctochytrium arcticum]